MVDFPNKRISFSNINKDVFYPSVVVTSASCMSVNVGDTMGFEDETKKVQNVLKLAPPTPRHDINIPASSKCEESPKGKRRKTPKAFSKFRVVIPLELRDKGEIVVQEMLNNTMKLFPGQFSGNRVSHTDIRHPVLRYIIRLLSNTILYRNEPGKVRHDELLALYSLISEDITWQSYGDLLRDLNWGAVFADRLLEQKNTPCTLKTELTDIRVGTNALYFLPDGRRAVVSRRTTRRVSASRRGSSSASAAAGSSSSARRLAPPPQVDMDPVQRWIVTSIQTLWDAFADLSRCGCVRPRSPTPPSARSPTPPPASSPAPDDDYVEIDAYHID
ncbi:hypothetical protein AALP_AAs64084U000100 [Arabis alpina]|uniref:Uncharacterized protein n=1 Tax=Arabis alpina TaxID=50452 RepID=A0A087G3F3_ARAAL|nr:hypothetical protein AALP_AAs64084U000100 [Arabis alpina]